MEQQGDPILMALLTKKARISLALQGREFLWEKRNALLQEFLEIAHNITQRNGALEGTTPPASECADGQGRGGEAGFREKGQDKAGRAGRNGTEAEFAQIESLIKACYSNGHVEDTTAPLAGEMERISKLAGNDVRLRRLAEEIRRLTRRLNVLDNALIPKLRKECNHIETELRKQG